MFTLITYDIESDYLRTKVAKYLEGQGTRVQYSVFECHLNQKEYNALKAQLRKLIVTATKRSKKKQEEAGGVSIRFYQLCLTCIDRVEIIGSGDLTSDYAYYIA